MDIEESGNPAGTYRKMTINEMGSQAAAETASGSNSTNTSSTASNPSSSAMDVEVGGTPIGAGMTSGTSSGIFPSTPTTPSTPSAKAEAGTPKVPSSSGTPASSIAKPSFSGKRPSNMAGKTLPTPPSSTPTKPAAPTFKSTVQQLSAKELEQAHLLFLQKRGFNKAEVASIAKQTHTQSQTNVHAPMQTHVPGIHTGTLNGKAPDTLSLNVHQYVSKMMLDNQTSVLNLIRSFNAKETALSSYNDAYKALGTWVDASLDVYRYELIHIMWPVFVHIFLDLQMKGYDLDASAFLSKWRRDHEALHAKEIQSLHSINSAAAISTNEIAKVFMERKVDVCMSSYSHQLLLSFLEASKLMIILQILNLHVNLKIISRVPLTRDEIEAGLAFLPGYNGNASHINNQTVLWGVLKETAESIAEVNKHRGDDPIPVPTTMTTLAGTGAQAKNKNATSGTVPLPDAKPRDSKQVIDKLNHIRQRMTVGRDALPSIAMYTFLNANDAICDISLSASGSRVCACMEDSTLRIWDLNKAGSYEIDEESKEYPYSTLVGHSDSVYCSDFSPCMKYIVSGSGDGTARLWDIATDKMMNLVCYKGHNYPIWDIAFAPVGFYFATASHDRTARIWSTDKKTCLRILAGHISDVDCLAWHPNCNYLVTGSTDSSCRMWDIQTGNCVRIFSNKNCRVTAVAVSYNGKYIVQGSADGTCTLWDIASGKQISVLQGHSDEITNIAFDRNDMLLSTASMDGTIRMWDLSILYNSFSTSTVRLNTTKPLSSFIRAFSTKSTPVSFLRYTERNLLLAAGVFSGTT